jgi:PIN domain nuclease of toxin-antitoxin system
VNLLLDTHVLLWWDQDDQRLSAAARELIANPDNDVFVSAASPWEIAIKVKRGKLAFTGSACGLIEQNGFIPLPITPEHGEAAGRMEWAHPDPFDRLLVVQALDERLVLVHADSQIRAYEAVSQLWARGAATGGAEG